MRERLRYRGLRARRGLSKLPLTLKPQSPSTRFVIVTRPRSGSNYLLSLLEHHPRVLMFGEKLRTGGLSALKAIQSAMRTPRAAWVDAVGFKLFYEHPYDGDHSNTWSELMSDRDLIIIHLERQAWLETVVSEELAKRTDQWVNRLDHVAQPTMDALQLDPHWLEQRFDLFQAQREQALRAMAHQRVLDVNYEDLRDHRQRTFDRLCDGLDLPRRIAKTYTRRQQNKPLDEVVINMAEIRAHFHHHRWSHLIPPMTPRIVT